MKWDRIRYQIQLWSWWVGVPLVWWGFVYLLVRELLR